MQRLGRGSGLLVAAAAVACGSDRSGFDATENDAAAPSSPAGGGDPAFGDAAADGSGDNAGAAEVFGHSSDTLYKLDPTTKAVTVVGTFKGCSFVTDIALDKDSNMYATTVDGLYTVDRTTAACALVASGTYPNSLSFVPIGTLDPTEESLVGYNQPDTYVGIDPHTGAIKNVGSIGQNYTSSGDIVSIKGGGTFLTVKGGPDGTCNDCLIQVNPTTGAFVTSWGPLHHADVFGISFWGGALYGFDAAGELFEVDFKGVAIEVTLLPIPSAPPHLSFQGAGSTTSAPLTPPH